MGKAWLGVGGQQSCGHGSGLFWLLVLQELGWHRTGQRGLREQLPENGGRGVGGSGRFSSGDRVGVACSTGQGRETLVEMEGQERLWFPVNPVQSQFHLVSRNLFTVACLTASGLGARVSPAISSISEFSQDSTLTFRGSRLWPSCLTPTDSTGARLGQPFMGTLWKPHGLLTVPRSVQQLWAKLLHLLFLKKYFVYVGVSPSPSSTLRTIKAINVHYKREENLKNHLQSQYSEVHSEGI